MRLPPLKLASLFFFHQLQLLLTFFAVHFADQGISFQGMGHVVDLPYTASSFRTPHPLIPRGAEMFYGGSHRGLHHAGIELQWKKGLSFFEESLKHL